MRVRFWERLDVPAVPATSPGGHRVAVVAAYRKAGQEVVRVEEEVVLVDFRGMRSDCGMDGNDGDRCSWHDGMAVW